MIGLERCKEIEPGERVYFSGGVVGAAGTARLMIEVYTFGDESRHISDAHAAARAWCVKIGPSCCLARPSAVLRAAHVF